MSNGSGPCSFARMLFMRGLLAGIVMQIVVAFTLGINLFMPLWDKRNQNLWDKISETLVVDEPNNAWGVSSSIVARTRSVRRRAVQWRRGRR